MDKIALIVGASGIVGGNLADLLIGEGDWVVHGLARTAKPRSGVLAINADIRDERATVEALSEIKPTHVFFTTWSRQATEAENIRVNGGMIRHVLQALSSAQSVQHVALVTGLKHYLGPFESYGKGSLPQTPFREEQTRLAVANFYYAQEDEVFAAASRDGYAWSVHRPHTIIGYALGNAMNMGLTLAVYASICRERGLAMRFPGSWVQWNSLTDMTDAKLLAAHMRWAATTTVCANQAFNVVNGDVFRWRWMWPRLAAWFDIDADLLASGDGQPLAIQLAEAQPVWSAMCEKYGLVVTELDDVASSWHTDADLSRPIEVVTDMSKSRKLGFDRYQATDDSFFELFKRLRHQRIIP